MSRSRDGIVAHRKAPPRRMSYEEFLRLPEEKGRCELISGWVVREPSPGYLHQAAVGNLHFLLRQHCQGTGRGLVLLGPFDTVLSRENVVQPDLLYVATERFHVVTRKRMQGPPDLAVEVISPYSVRKDRVWRLSHYARAGIREYWIADPERRSIEVFVLADTSASDVGPRYEALGIFTPGTSLRSMVLPGFTCDPAEVFPA